MKLGRKQLFNGLLILGLAILLLTPIGFKVKVMLSRLLSSSVAMVKEELRLPLDTYEWKLTDTEGKRFDFATQKGEVVLVNFWATWCPPCVAEMPSMQKLYDAYGGKVTFMFVTTEDPQKVAAFLERKGYTVPVYYPQTEAPKTLDHKLLSTTYVVDREGKIVVAETGASDWNSDKVHTLLDGLLLTK
jgi:thiol-disulfide isomerase/thioredoxin